ncbi:MAG: hypothetical protein JW892_11805, partial [Anaerolineae bacterium]|nr:hypothetical protein [Anaerolineae bacterium]
MKLKTVFLTMVLILGLLFGNSMFFGSVRPATAYPSDEQPESVAPSAIQTQNQSQSASLPILADFETENVDAWFTYGDWGNGAVLDKSVALTTTLSALGVTSNTVMLVDYVAAGWGVGVGKDTVPFQDWSAYDGFSFWFQGTNSGVQFKIILTD